MPVVGTVVSIALMATKGPQIFARAALLLLVGIALWALNWWLHGRYASSQI
jgi:hypothetical protein